MKRLLLGFHVAAIGLVTAAPVSALAQCFNGPSFTCSESSATSTSPIFKVVGTGASTFPTVAANQTSGVGVAVSGVGNGSNSIGLSGVAEAADGTGVSGVSTDTSSTASYGVYATANGSSGVGVYGYNSSTGIAAIAVYGTSSSGVGVHGEGLVGVYGASSSASTYGVDVQSYTKSNTNPGISLTGTSSLDGNVFVTGSGTYTGTWQHQSDIRLKKNIVPLSGSLSRLLKLRGVTFQWKDPEKHAGLCGPQEGFIAQEVETVFPEWVGQDKDGYRTLVTDSSFPAVAVEAIRELKSQKDDDDRRAEELRVRLKKVEKSKLRAASILGVQPLTRSGVGLALIALLAGLAIGRNAGRKS